MLYYVYVTDRDGWTRQVHNVRVGGFKRFKSAWAALGKALTDDAAAETSGRIDVWDEDKPLGDGAIMTIAKVNSRGL